MTTAVLRPNPGDIAGRMRGVLETARAKKISVSQELFQTCEIDKEDRAQGMDAFNVVLREMGIQTTTLIEQGIVADTVDAFGKDDNTRIAFGEWLERRKREVQAGPRALSGQRALYTSADQPVGTPVNQIAFDMQPYYQQIAPAVPIAEVVAKTTPIIGGTYEAYFLTDVTTQKRYTRIPEGAEIPAVKLSGSNHIIKVRKFGRRLDVTYEQLRRMRIDLLALHIQRMMVQAEVDKLAAILDIMVNGDSSNSSNAATVYTLSSLDAAATPGTSAGLTLRAYLRFKAKFRNPYKVTTILGQEDAVVATQLLSTGSANIPLLVLQNQGGNPYGNFTPINNELGDAVRIGLTDDAPSNKLVGLDSRFAIERIIEQDSDITESTRWVEKQTQSLVMSFDEAYAVIDQNAIKVLDMAN